MKTFSPKNKIYGLIKVLMATITIVSTIGYSPFNAIFLTSASSSSIVPVAQACEEPKICNLTLTKTDSIDPVAPGDELVYHLTLKNTGTGDCTGTGVLLKDVFDQNTTYVGSSKTPAEITSEYIKWNFGTVTSGETESVDLTMLVSEDAQCGSLLINKASFWSSQTGWSAFVTQETFVLCPPEPVCGDGIKNDSEECDGTDGVPQHYICTDQCKLEYVPYCGDGIKNGSEDCDGTDGVLEHYKCTENCELQLLPFCGDGILQPGEQCDDGNIVSGDGCSAQCETETLCQPGETKTDFSYLSKPQITYIDNSTTNVAYKLCSDTCGSGISVDTSNGQPHYIYLTWDNLNPSEYNGFLNFNLKLNHMESQTNVKVELKNQSGIWVEVCDPAERTSYTWDTCNLAPYSLILKELSIVELRIVATESGACHEYLKCAKLEAELYKCEGPQPYCGDGTKNDSEECDGTDGVGAHQSCGQDCKLINLPWCGDGIKNDAEECDGTDGVGEHYTCTAQCTLEYVPYCGDNLINQPAEECDGTTGVGEHQACTSECKLIDIPYCGNGIKEGEEQCDGQDGVTEHYICTDQCTLEYVPYCGDQTCDGNENCETCAEDCGACCIPEGGSGAVVPGGPSCCAGLVQIGCSAPIAPEFGGCSDCVGAFYCTMCGNGICGLGENRCNCPQDCEEVCDPDLELIKNGGFESPLIADSQSWNIFSSVYGWHIEWVSLTPAEFGGYFRPTNAYLELQNSAVGWDPQEGSQLAELDSDWDGPSGTLNGEPASVKINQDIPTIVGANYHISFWFSPRPNTGLEENRLEFRWNNEVKDTLEAAGENNTTWVKYEYTFTATDTTTNLQFADLGYSDSLGTFLDNVSVKCVPPQEPYCGDNIKNGSEQCDGTDGVGAHQSCSQDCQLINLPWCGDGVKNDSEECDGTDGISAHYTCTAQCTLQYIPYCGDNIVNQTSEQCDGTAGVGQNQACTSECILINIPTCGNGVKEGQEECDGTDGVIEHHTCTSQCTLEYIPYCGDNIVNQTSEQCDGTAGVGQNQTCTAECILQNIPPGPICGDNIKNGSEQCDGTDGVGAHQTCSGTCTLINIPFCGDAICNNEESCSSCSSDCGSCGGGGGGGGGGGSPYPALAIIKTVAESTITAGGTLNYTITLKNNGFATAINVNLKDTLPAGFTFKDNGLNEKEWNLGDIAYGVTKITTFQALVGTGVAAGDYQNTSVAKADNQGAIYGLATTTIIAGQVLGERIELPNTGQSPIWFVIIGLSLVFTSLLTIVVLRRTIILQDNK